MASIFSKIVSGEIPSYKVAESEDFYAFLDINPMTAGHTLVIPKKETDYIFDIDDESFGRFFLFAKRVAEAVKRAVPCKRVGIAVLGMEVPHAHIHLVPLEKESDLDFSRDKLKLDASQMEIIAKSIYSEFKL